MQKTATVFVPVIALGDLKIKVAPNLGRLLEFQRENLLGNFAGGDRELDKLEEHFDRYAGHYRNYVRLYEQGME